MHRMGVEHLFDVAHGIWIAVWLSRRIRLRKVFGF
jgi:hypothetical protein